MSRREGKLATTLGRSMIERKRRMFTKHLLSKLAFVINPTQTAPTVRAFGLYSSVLVSLSVFLPWTYEVTLYMRDTYQLTPIELVLQATAYVKELQQRVEMLKQRKQLLLESINSTEESAEMRGSMPTVFTVADLDSAIEVCLISRSKEEFILPQVINVLDEEAAPVVALSYSCVGNMINYWIYSEVGINVMIKCNRRV